MLIVLKMMRVRGEVPLDKADFDVMVGDVPKFMMRPEGARETMAEMIGSYLTLMHRDYEGKSLSGLAAKDSENDTVLVMIDQLSRQSFGFEIKPNNGQVALSKITRELNRLKSPAGEGVFSMAEMKTLRVDSGLSADVKRSEEECNKEFFKKMLQLFLHDDKPGGYHFWVEDCVKKTKVEKFKNKWVTLRDIIRIFFEIHTVKTKGCLEALDMDPRYHG